VSAVEAAVERMFGDIAGLGDQLRQSEAEARKLPVLRQPGAVCIAGLGGSAISADLAEGLWGGAARVPIVVRRDSVLPGFVGRESLLIALSYSGETLETLRCAEAALSRGAQLVAITGGGSLGALAESAGAPVVRLTTGLQPRAATGYLFAALAVALEQARVIPDVSADLAAAAEACAAVAATRGGEGARELGHELATCTTWVSGYGPLAAVARRWKTQLNENAKGFAFHGPLPEADHNEICGWPGATRAGGRTAAILLTDPEDPERIGVSVRYTLESAEQDTAVRQELTGQGDTRAARAFWLLSVGDHVSNYAAEAAGLDPYDIERLSTLKALLPRD
jgi:glucose/mannose-6-phosphate isomerase